MASQSMNFPHWAMNQVMSRRARKACPRGFISTPILLVTNALQAMLKPSTVARILKMVGTKPMSTWTALVKLMSLVLPRTREKRPGQSIKMVGLGWWRIGSVRAFLKYWGASRRNEVRMREMKCDAVGQDYELEFCNRMLGVHRGCFTPIDVDFGFDCPCSTESVAQRTTGNRPIEIDCYQIHTCDVRSQCNLSNIRTLTILILSVIPDAVYGTRCDSDERIPLWSSVSCWS